LLVAHDPATCHTRNAAMSPQPCAAKPSRRSCGPI
jgi:hypothetical protein